MCGSKKIRLEAISGLVRYGDGLDEGGGEVEGGELEECVSVCVWRFIIILGV